MDHSKGVSERIVHERVFIIQRKKKTKRSSSFDGYYGRDSRDWIPVTIHHDYKNAVETLENWMAFGELTTYEHRIITIQPEVVYTPQTQK